MANLIQLTRVELSAEHTQDLRLAASQMRGAERRAFQAEMRVVEARFDRHPLLPKWDILIHPAVAT